MRWSEGAEIKVFAGQQFDAETGLYHLRARSYDPATGRFTQRDPAGPMAGAAHESSYLYAAGAPMRWVDPTGLRIAEAEQREQLAQSNLWKTNPLAAATEALKDPHVFLDVAGFIPVIGIVADAANAALYAVEGDWANAAISAVAMIPAAGSVLAAGLRHSDEALAVGRLARHSDEVASAGRTVAKNFDEGIDLSGIGLKHGDEVVPAPRRLAGSVNAAGGTRNCVSCAIAGDSTLAGRPASAVDLHPGVPIPNGNRAVAEYAGSPWKSVSGQADIESELLGAGNGARGIVYGGNPERAHVWNAIVQKGHVNFVDFQGIGPNGADSFETWDTLFFVRTN